MILVGEEGKKLPPVTNISGSCPDYVSQTRRVKQPCNQKPMVPPQGKYNRSLWSLCHHLTYYCCSLYSDLLGYYGSNLWHDVSNKLININVLNIWCQCLLRILKRYTSSLINVKSHGGFLGVAHCHAYQHAKILVLRSRSLGAFFQRPCTYLASRGRSQSWRRLLGHLGKESSYL